MFHFRTSTFAAMASAIALVALHCSPPPDEPDVPTVSSDGGSDAGGDVYTNDRCEFQNDGTCDEPASCPLGTDEADCTDACNNAEDISGFVAACAHRNLLDDDEEGRTGPSHPNYESPDGSGGSDHRTGWRDATLELPDGANPNSSVTRHFRVYVPKSYDPDQPHPLMITMPGHRVSHYVLGGFTMLHRTATMNDFIVVYAGQQFWDRGDHWHWWTEWYGSEMTNPPDFCRGREGDSHPDYQFIRDLVDWSSNQYNIDRRRVYVSGHSRGAATALMTALDNPDLIAGAAIESGYTECGYLNEIVGSSAWSRRKPTLVFVHGTEDPDVCINCSGSREQCNAAFDDGRRGGCRRGQHAADALVDRFESVGWSRGDSLKYFRLERVGHDWQAHLNQQVWDFLADRPLPADQ